MEEIMAYRSNPKQWKARKHILRENGCCHWLCSSRSFSKCAHLWATIKIDPEKIRFDVIGKVVSMILLLPNKRVRSNSNLI